MKISSRLKIAISSFAMPDQFNYIKGEFKIPPDDFVVSRDSKGNVVSRFGDDVWIFTSYSTVGPCAFNWSSWSQEVSPLKDVISLELKLLCFAILYFDRTRVSAGTLRTYVTDLRRIAKEALKAGCTLAESSDSVTFHKKLKVSLSAASRSVLLGLHTVYIKLLDIQGRHPELNIKLSSAPVSIILTLLELIEKKPNQVPIVPTRIYSDLIQSLRTLIDDFLSSASGIHQLYINRHSVDPSYGLSKITSKLRKQHHDESKSLEVVAKELSLEDFFRRNCITDNRNILSHLSLIQLACKWYIHIFSGMRDTECRTLPLDSFQQIATPSGPVCVFNGYTSKLTGEGQKPTYWITSIEAEPAFKCAQAVAEIIYTRHGINTSDYKSLPLFPATHFHYGVPHPGYGIPLAKLAATLSPVLLKRLNVRIGEVDIEELELFDGFRDWRSESKYSVGELWPFTSHQARRSLAVYAARSGLVSIGTLSLQFKHLTIAMTSYYMNNASFAVNFIHENSQRELVDELNSQRKIAEFISFDNNVINTKSMLFGGEGTRIQLAKEKSQINIELDRTMTENKFRNGEMSYKPSILGGCSFNGPCSKISFTNILVCTSCPHSILDETSITRMDQALHSLDRKKSLFAPASPSHQQLENEVTSLAKFIDRHKYNVKRRS